MALAILISLVLAAVQVPQRSKTSLRSCFIVQSFLYWLVLSVGNVVTTLLASTAVIKLPVNLSQYYFLFCAFFGVFGFQGILKNTNITMFDKGVLTIQDWIENALNGAAAAAIAHEDRRNSAAENRLVELLMQRTDQDINTRVLTKLGANAVTELNAAANASAANPKMYKILQLITKLSASERAALLAEATKPSPAGAPHQAPGVNVQAAPVAALPLNPVLLADPERNDG
jgi:hypothetical protein